MGSPFPGMDPYLESPGLWPDVHANLITTIQSLLNRAIRPRHVCGVEERLYISPDPYPRLIRARILDANVTRTPVAAGIPTATQTEWPQEAGYTRLEVEEIVEPLHEPYLVIRQADSERIVTIIEVLSVANKAKGSEVQKEYQEKRSDVLRSNAHLVEIDLLRDGIRPVKIPPQHAAGDVYGVYLNRWPRRFQTEVLLWSLPIRLPVIPIPLQNPDPPAKLDLQSVLERAYESGAYALRVDYENPPPPPLTPESAAWVEAQVATWGGGTT